ncbi:collagen alpha-1(I) chain-like [Antechinus flavipes]|uniref:collagen alpha-1(I) chain-like n=1 Tax=Antechinus flavipes TaxID=38775 RepID=UPI0022364DB8|nr:collagen alpha-1(I) chain-like [Antechinus flavipes]
MRSKSQRAGWEEAEQPGADGWRPLWRVLRNLESGTRRPAWSRACTPLAERVGTARSPSLKATEEPGAALSGPLMGQAGQLKSQPKAPREEGGTSQGSGARHCQPRLTQSRPVTRDPAATRGVPERPMAGREGGRNGAGVARSRCQLAQAGLPRGVVTGLGARGFGRPSEKRPAPGAPPVPRPFLPPNPGRRAGELPRLEWNEAACAEGLSPARPLRVQPPSLCPSPDCRPSGSCCLPPLAPHPWAPAPPLGLKLRGGGRKSGTAGAPAQRRQRSGVVGRGRKAPGRVGLPRAEVPPVPATLERSPSSLGSYLGAARTCGGLPGARARRGGRGREGPAGDREAEGASEKRGPGRGEGRPSGSAAQARPPVLPTGLGGGSLGAVSPNPRPPSRDPACPVVVGCPRLRGCHGQVLGSPKAPEQEELGGPSHGPGAQEVCPDVRPAPRAPPPAPPPPPQLQPHLQAGSPGVSSRPMLRTGAICMGRAGGGFHLEPTRASVVKFGPLPRRPPPLGTGGGRDWPDRALLCPNLVGSHLGGPPGHLPLAGPLLPPPPPGPLLGSSFPSATLDRTLDLSPGPALGPAPPGGQEFFVGRSGQKRPGLLLASPGARNWSPPPTAWSFQGNVPGTRAWGRCPPSPRPPPQPGCISSIGVGLRSLRCPRAGPLEASPPQTRSNGRKGHEEEGAQACRWDLDLPAAEPPAMQTAQFPASAYSEGLEPPKRAGAGRQRRGNKARGAPSSPPPSLLQPAAPTLQGVPPG